MKGEGNLLAREKGLVSVGEDQRGGYDQIHYMYENIIMKTIIVSNIS